MAEYEEITTHIDTLMKKWIKEIQAQIDDIRVKVSDIHTIHADNIHIMNSLRDFFQKSSSLFGPDACATKVAAKKTTKKKKAADEDTIKTIEYQSVDKPTRYNTFVRLLKEEEDFAEKVTKAWRKIDKKISDDSHRVDYILFYETFLSSKAKETDNVGITAIIDEIQETYESDKTAAAKAKKRIESKKASKSDE